MGIKHEYGCHLVLCRYLTDFTMERVDNSCITNGPIYRLSPRTTRDISIVISILCHTEV